MFEKKRCPNCGEKVKEDWNFCPYCGEELEVREKALTPFGDIFEDIEKEFERMDKMFGSPFKLSGFKSKPLRGGGISITIRSGTGMEPKVEIKTSGDYKKIEPELKRRFGVKPAIEEVEEEKEEKPRVERKAKVTEEAETEVKTLGNKQIISVKLPDVESEDDIEIKRLEQSIEIKAFAGDKAYFTLVPLPASAAIVKKEFKNGVLRIEVEK
jgi:HSP20 family molecular chaperone IbpA